MLATKGGLNERVSSISSAVHHCTCTVHLCNFLFGDHHPKNRTKLLMCTFDEVFGFKSAELMKCLQGRSLTQFATKNIGCFVYELNRESDYTDKNNVLLFVQAVFQCHVTQT